MAAHHNLHPEQFQAHVPSTEIDLYTDPYTWDEDRLDEWAASEPVTKAAAWLRDHNGPF